MANQKQYAGKHREVGSKQRKFKATGSVQLQENSQCAGDYREQRKTKATGSVQLQENSQCAGDYRELFWRHGRTRLHKVQPQSGWTVSLAPGNSPQAG